MTQRERAAEVLRPLAQHPDADVRQRVAAALRMLEPAGNGPGLIPAHGDYRKLASYTVAEIVYDATVVFCERFIRRGDRTNDQMVQAARSGKQNIAEGCMASGTSKKTELKLVGVARASLEELRVDYEDFLRTRRLPRWGRDTPETLEVRALSRLPDRSFATYEPRIRHGSPEVAANTLICLVHQACFLLDRQLKALEEAFLENGGFTERLYRMRSRQRDGG